VVRKGPRGEKRPANVIRAAVKVRPATCRKRGEVAENLIWDTTRRHNGLTDAQMTATKKRFDVDTTA
jgi:hypothetical protein